MGNLGFKITLILFCTCMFFFVIWRFFSIFHNNSKIIPLIIALILAIFVTLTFMYSGNSKIFDIVGTLSSWIFVLGFLLMILLLVEYLISTRYKINPRIIVGIIVLILGLGTYFSLHTKITYLNIETDKIHKDTKILLVSDIHAEHITSTFHINKIRKTIEAERPDFTIIAGDLINKSNDGYAQYFKDIQPDPIPLYPYYDSLVYAVMGNHDVMSNTKAIQKVGKVGNIIFLNNESNIFLNGVTIKDGCNANDVESCTGTIQLVGLVDKSLWGDRTLEQNLKDTNIDILNENSFTILVTHQPISLEKLKDYPIDLEVAGHTHRGQFFGMRKVIEWMNDYAYGEYKLGDKTAFVTQGIGTWGLPFRLGTQSEMVIINLEKVKKK